MTPERPMCLTCCFWEYESILDPLDEVDEGVPRSPATVRAPKAECHRYPPLPNDAYAFAHPTTDFSNWCGEHRQADPVELNDRMKIHADHLDERERVTATWRLLNEAERQSIMERERREARDE